MIDPIDMSENTYQYVTRMSPMLEIVLGLAQKTISNYVNHLARTPVDKQYEKYAWNKVG